jgi:hypothetical protein
MSETEIIDSGVPAARIAGIRVHKYGVLEVTWAEGERAGRIELVDLLPAIFSYKVYRPLRNNLALFATARLVDNGFAVVWKGADQLDMSADLIESLATESISPDQFASFLKRNKLTQDAAAAILGRSRRQIGYYLKEGPIPRVIALACFGYEYLRSRQKETDPASIVPEGDRVRLRELI